MIAYLSNLLPAVESWWTSAIVLATIIMFGALGEIITEKSGHLNLGVPGIMLLGGFASFAGAFIYENSTDTPNFVLLLLIPLVCAFSVSALAGLLYSFFTVTLKANQNVTGLALTSFGVGIGSFGGQFIIDKTHAVSAYASKTSALFRKSLFIKDFTNINAFVNMFFSYGFVVYAAIIMAVLIHFFLKRSRAGLNLRAIGENPATADAAGVNVTKYKYLSTIIGGGISGLGGMVYVLYYSAGMWTTNNSIKALGWLAVALVIFATWKPLNAIWGSYVFALLYIFFEHSNVLGQNNFSSAQSSIVKMLPYVVTIIILIVISFQKKRENQPPQSLGVNYYREER